MEMKDEGSMNKNGTGSLDKQLLYSYIDKIGRITDIRMIDV